MSDVNPSPGCNEPFDPRGGFTLRTSDNVEFRVQRAILETASSVFEGMFGIPQPEIDAGGQQLRGNEAEASVIDLSEDAETLEALLLCIYPGEKPSIGNVNLAIKLTLAADKYMIALSCLTSPIYFCLLRQEENGQSKLLLRYALAWKLGFKELAMNISHDIIRSKEYQTQRIPFIAEDEEAELALLSAQRDRNKAMLDLNLVLGIRIGLRTCSECPTQTHTYTKQGLLRSSFTKSPLPELGRTASVLLTDLVHRDWLLHKSALVPPTRLETYLNEVEREIAPGGKCPSCRLNTAPNHSARAYSSFPQSCTLVNAITWTPFSLYSYARPAGKPDKT